MYRQFKIHPMHTSLQRILWRPITNEPVKTCDLVTVTYGTSSAPYLATRSLNQLAIEEGALFPTASTIIQRDFYVDDLLTGARNVQEGKQLIREVNLVLSKGGFTLRKWASNISDVLTEVTGDKKPTLLSWDSDKPQKTLGLQWHSASDTLQYRISQFDCIDVITKRSVLPRIAQIFDPLGLLSPIVVRSKLLMQCLWQLQLDWDESIPANIHTLWLNFQQELDILHDIKVPRKILASNYEFLEIHGFSDASERAYGVCVYIRSVTKNHVTSSLLCSKSRVAPLKSTTLPRLELCGALLLARLIVKVRSILNNPIRRTCLWTDSTIVLAWLKASSKTWKTFVANRVGKIQDLSDINDWYHIATHDNLADLVSRGVTASELLNNDIWWHGPCWLTQLKMLQLQQPMLGEVPKEKTRNQTVTMIMSQKETFHIFTRYSCQSKLNRIAAYCIRYITNLRARITRTDDLQVGPLTIEEVTVATSRLIRNIQEHAFEDEIRCLSKNSPLSNRSKILCLNPFLDENRLMRVGGSCPGMLLACLWKKCGEAGIKTVHNMFQGKP
ncbi:Pao retrotransposon peptidase [Popillia japonica]|uniref:Pao retrotransposon peptidase n=1 Tax=Popillia japonica TaxID=7064 RepID=A0AAW1HRU5_POPJA